MNRPYFTEDLVLAGYWGPRPEDAQSCARRLSAFLNDISSIDPLFNTWFEKGDSPQSAFRAQLGTSFADMTDFLRKEWRGDAPGARRAIVSMWNGQPHPVSLSTICGLAPKSPNLGNNILLDLPRYEGDEDLYNANNVLALIRATIESWQPSWATFSSAALRQVQQVAPREVLVGWATYLSRDRVPRKMRLPAEASMTSSEDGGVLITLGGAPTSLDPDLTVAVRAALGSAVAVGRY